MDNYIQGVRETWETGDRNDICTINKSKCERIIYIMLKKCGLYRVSLFELLDSEKTVWKLN